MLAFHYQSLHSHNASLSLGALVQNPQVREDLRELQGRIYAFLNQSPQRQTD